MHLLHLVDLAERLRNVDILNESLVEEAEEYFAPLHQFLKSFRKDAKDLWDYISGPYLNIDDLGDFVAGDDEDVADGVSARLMYRELELQKQEEELDDDAELVSRYQHMSQAGDDSGESSRDESSTSEEEGEESNGSDEGAGLSDSDDESEDSWMKERQKKMAKTIRKRQSKEFRRTSRTSRASLSPETIKPQGASISSSKKRNILTIEDSSDGDE